MTTQQLFQPFSLGSLSIANRIVLAPMTRGRAGLERVPGELMAEYYLQRAGAGLIISEATVVSPQGIGWIDSPGIYTEQMVDGWRLVTETVKPTGTPMFFKCGIVEGHRTAIFTMAHFLFPPRRLSCVVIISIHR